MPLAQQLILNIPTIPLCLLVVGCAVVFSISGLLVVRKLIPHHRLKPHNDVSGPIFATAGVLYAVLLAFVVIIVWQNFDKANTGVQNEANCLVNLYRNAECFAPEFRQEIRSSLRDYAKSVINDEWVTIERGEPSQRTEKVVEKIWSLYSNYLPKNETERAFFEESIREISQLDELRITRVLESRTGINPILWLVLIAGGVITIIFTFFLGAENPALQITLSVLLAVLIALIVFTILALDFPFTGDIIVLPRVFVKIASLG